MNQIIEYKIVSSTDINKVAEQVNELIKATFQPFGAVCSSYCPDEEVFYTFQAVVKYSTPGRSD